MTFYYILEDGHLIARTATRETAMAMIRDYQKMQTHPILKAEYTIIEGKTEESVPYK